MKLTIKGKCFANSGNGVLQFGIHFCCPFPHNVILIVGLGGIEPCAINQKRNGKQGHHCQFPMHIKKYGGNADQSQDRGHDLFHTIDKNTLDIIHVIIGTRHQLTGGAVFKIAHG